MATDILKLDEDFIRNKSFNRYTYDISTSHVKDDNYTNSSMDHNQIIAILQQQQYMGRFGSTTQSLLITVFATFIAIGAIGNGLVCYVVVRNSHMRTPRNIFIINLAISDLTLCLFTQPLNLYRLLYDTWMLGSFMCKFSGMCQGTNVFVSTISITAIALDRFQVIVYPTKDSMKKIGAAGSLISIWIISFLMASPLLIFSMCKVDAPVPGIDFNFYRCIEDISLKEEKGAYSIASMVVQYILPIVIVIIAHARICNKLRYRMVNTHNTGARSEYHNQKSKRQNRRKRRTNILLAMIAIVFACSWLPLNIFNILSEFKIDLFKKVNINLAYVICHILVLSSACTNPLLYGWLNENFRTEFVKILYCKCCAQLRLIFARKFRCCVDSNDCEVPVIVFTKETNCNTTQIDREGYSVTGLHSVNDTCINRSQVSL